MNSPSNSFSTAAQPALLPAWPWRRWLLAFGVALTVLGGPAFPTYRHYDFSHSRDSLTYLHLARGQTAGQSVTRRYRVVVPALAATVAAPLRALSPAPLPPDPRDDAPLRLAFFLVNTLLLAGAGALLWRTAEAYGATPLAAGLGVAVALSSRWATYSAALPLTDSLYCLVFALALYGVRTRSWAALVACLLLGPLAKESFVFVVPWVLWFGRRTLPWPVLLALLAGGFGAVAGAHLWVDARAVGEPAVAAGSVQNALHHVENLTYSLRRLFSAHGAAEMFSVFGFGWLLLLAGPWRGPTGWWAHLDGAARWLPVVLVPHLLLSGDLGRMSYLVFPVFGVAVALVFSGWAGRNVPAAR